ncbi:MAG: hypothetical protein AB8G17_11915 [Gammaproteobacteria bacterium]
MKTGLLCSALLLATPAATAANPVTVDDLFAASIGEPSTAITEPTCGKDTIASVTTKANDLYLFCADTDGKTVVVEIREDRGDETLLDETLSPVQLLRTVVPKGMKIPGDVVDRLATGKAQERSAPFKVGEWDVARAAEVAAVDRASCNTPSLGMSPSAFFNNTTYCGWVAGQSASSSNSAWHAHGASYMNIPGEGSSNHAGPHLPPFEFYYADEDELGDARYGRARVRSCGGTTRLRSWVKASANSGSWTPKWNWTISSGHTATMVYYANPQHSMWMGYDADDIFFRVDNPTGSFGSRLYFFKYAYGQNCDMKF